jgi:hypothetical protein
MSEQSYPTMRYHPTEPPQMVNTVEELQALGDPWRPEPYSPEEQAAYHSQQAQAQAAQSPPQPGQPRAGQAPPLPTEEPKDDEGGTATPRSRR